MKSPLLLIILLVIGCISCKNNQKPEDKDMNSEYSGNQRVHNNTSLELSIETYVNLNEEDEVNVLVADNYIRNMNGIPVVTNKSELKARLNLYSTGFPDHNITMSNSKVCDNQGYVNWVFTGTHTGLFADVVATGKKVKINGFSHLYFNEEGKIYQEDIFYNELEFLQQLGYSLVAPILK